MKMKDIAQNLDFHESTISRGVNGKYMLTPFGIYEFKYFFSSALETNYDNLASSVSIKRMIQETLKRKIPILQVPLQLEMSVIPEPIV